MKKLSLQYILGVFLILTGLYFSLTTINSINTTRVIGGPMAISVFPLDTILLFGINIIIIYYGTILSRLSLGKTYLILASISIILVTKNVWLYPSVDGAYYLLRYGKSILIYPTPWQHIIAFTYSGVLLYVGLTKTFNSNFSFIPYSHSKKFMYKVSILLSVCVLFFTLGLLYESFGKSFMYAQYINSILVFIIPICLIIFSSKIKKYDKIALIFFLSGLLILLLLGVTLLALLIY